VLARLRDVFGADRVVDNVAVGGVVAPPNWSGYAQRLIGPNLKTISRGQVTLDGNNLTVRGEVASESVRQQVVSEMAANLNPNYVVKNSLRVTLSDQSVVDRALADRIIEFEPGSTQLTVSGQAILDEIAATLKTLANRKVEVIGHTDALGRRDYNLALSGARANAVKTYLVGKGIKAELVNVSGEGPDRPVASNSTPQGRARNRRIEFRVSQ
jgi:OOP family OmpA-OmpF porin